MAYTGQILRTTLTQEIRWRRCFWGMGGGQVSVVYELVWLSDRGEAGNGSPAPLKWRCVGQWCREEQHLCPINQSHQNHIITTFSDTLISCFTGARKTRAGWGKSLRKPSNSSCLLWSPTHNKLLVLGSWHEVSSSDSCCSWSKWDVKLLCMQFLWSHIHGWLESLTDPWKLICHSAQVDTCVELYILSFCI